LQQAKAELIPRETFPALGSPISPMPAVLQRQNSDAQHYDAATRKASFGKLLSCRVLLVWIVALNKTVVPASGQEVASAATVPVEEIVDKAPPSDPTAFMLLASQSCGLSQIGDQTWHRKATFEAFDEQGNNTDQGA
jgi:hypothetical protein